MFCNREALRHLAPRAAFARLLWLLVLTLAAALQASPAQPAPARHLNCDSPVLPKIEDKASGRTVLVVVDKTVVFSPLAVRNLQQWTMRAIHAGDDVEIVSFSALTVATAADVELRVHVKGGITARELSRQVPMLLADAVQRCRAREIDRARSAIADKLQKLATTPVPDDVRSEIVETLSRLAVGHSGRGPGRDPIVIVASDMLQNSTPRESFYRSGNLLSSKLSDYLNSMASLGFLGRFNGARVFVIGVATVAPGRTPLTPTQRQDLQRFWCAWFHRSNARVSDWGTASLFQDAGTIDRADNRWRDACS